MKFNIKTFYLILGIAMLISFGGNLWNLILVWKFITIGAKITSIAGSLFFNIMFSMLFFTMYKSTPDMEVSNTALDDIVKEIKKQNAK